MLTCKCYRTYEGDYDCEYSHAGEISCEHCIINGGEMSPQTGKKFKGNLLPYIELAQKTQEEKLINHEYHCKITL